MENTLNFTEEELVKRRSKKMLLYIGIFSIVMLFAGFTSAYVVAQADSFWVSISLPSSFYISTALILLSSTTMWAAVKAAKQGNVKKTGQFVLFTLLLGIGFSYFQFKGWGQLFDRGHTTRGENIFMIKGEYGKDYSFYYKGEPMIKVDGAFYAASDKLHEKPLTDALMGSRDSASSYLIAITFLHFLHLAGGLIYLLIVQREAVKGKYVGKNLLRLELCSTYWHFLDGLWLYLLLFLLFIH